MKRVADENAFEDLFLREARGKRKYGLNRWARKQKVKQHSKKWLGIEGKRGRVQDVTTHGDKRWRSLCGHTEWCKLRLLRKVNAEAAMLGKPFVLSHNETGAASVDERRPAKIRARKGGCSCSGAAWGLCSKQLQIMRNLVRGKPPNN